MVSGASAPPWAKLLLPIAGTALLAFVGWRSTSIGMADWWARQNPEAALEWRPDHAEAALQAAEVAVYSDAASPVVAESSRSSIAAYPLDGRAYRLLADAPGTPPNLARALHEIAAERSPRDYLSQAWAINDALQADDYARALARLDNMMRARPEIAHHLTPVLAGIASTPEAQAALAAVLSQNPPWRDTVFPRLIDAASSGQVLGALMEDLRARPGGVTAVEQATWLNRLVRDKQYGIAYLAWIASLSSAQQQSIGNVYDGGFEFEPSGAPFDWNFQQVAGAQIEIAAVEGGSGRTSLRIAFDERATQFSHVSQTLLLAPGRYRFSGRERMADMGESRGLMWAVTCVEDGKPLLETARMSGDHDWQAFGADFDVPVLGCTAQQLALRMPPGSESSLAGAAAFDDLAIETRYGEFP